MVTFTELGVMAVVLAGLTEEVESVRGSLESRAMLKTFDAPTTWGPCTTICSILSKVDLFVLEKIETSRVEHWF